MLENEKIVDPKNIASYWIEESDLFSEDMKKRAKRKKYSKEKRKILQLLRYRSVVNVYLFQTIIYRGIYPDGDFDFELFLNGDRFNIQCNKFLLLCNSEKTYQGYIQNRIVLREVVRNGLAENGPSIKYIPDLATENRIIHMNLL